jgi:hypothetical protein
MMATYGHTFQEIICTCLQQAGNAIDNFLFFLDSTFGILKSIKVLLDDQNQSMWHLSACCSHVQDKMA